MALISYLGLLLSVQSAARLPNLEILLQILSSYNLFAYGLFYS